MKSIKLNKNQLINLILQNYPNCIKKEILMYLKLAEENKLNNEYKFPNYKEPDVFYTYNFWKLISVVIFNYIERDTANDEIIFIKDKELYDFIQEYYDSLHDEVEIFGIEYVKAVNLFKYKDLKYNERT